MPNIPQPVTECHQRFWGQCPLAEAIKARKRLLSILLFPLSLGHLVLPLAPLRRLLPPLSPLSDYEATAAPHYATSHPRQISLSTGGSDLLRKRRSEVMKSISTPSLTSSWNSSPKFRRITPKNATYSGSTTSKYGIPTVLHEHSEGYGFSHQQRTLHHQRCKPHQPDSSPRRHG